MADRLSFGAEFVDFWRFVRRPTLRRLPGRHPHGGLAGDWAPNIGFARLMAWAGVLWAINLFALGPIAVMAAGAGGAVHRLDPMNIPWLAAVLWAPLVEELLFRHGLRRPLQALWLCPLLLPPILLGPMGWTIAWVGCLMIVLCLPLRRGRVQLKGWRTAWRREYVRHYGMVFHLVSITFAAVHLNNFTLQGMAVYMLPLLVLPQWMTGMVLGWMRTRRGIGAAILLHGVFNGGPVLFILLMAGLTQNLPIPMPQQ